MRNLEIQHTPLPHIPVEWARTWHEGNLIYPQSLAGYNATLGPILVKELMGGHFSLNSFAFTPFEKNNLQSLTDHSNEVHKIIHLPANLKPENIEMLWGSSLAQISRCLVDQIDRCVGNDQKLSLLLDDPYHKNEGIDRFFQTKKYQKHFGWISGMWVAASQSLLSRELKAKGKILFQTVLDFYHNKDAHQTGSRDEIMKPIWYEIRNVTQKSILDGVKLPFTPRRNRRLVYDFVNDFASGNVIQQAQPGETARPYE